ncbi:MAG TPA: LysR family transcriptional regulator [Candidatus Sulfotelmatobacter sp.]|jgi:DNA-binding transcriptional LysR family regulator|nr:LysR family transcriptional regulator [Candidatus Sulfotelmatobacter sp.]
MEILQLETFLAVATYGGFHRAAEALRISQPAVSARISTLEESLGTRLFEREHGKFSLSLAGKALRPHAEQLLRQVAIARQAVHEMHPIAGGALPIAASLSICTYLLPEVLKKYQESHPNVIVSVRSGNSAQVLKMVLDGEVDLGLARSLNHPEVETIQLRDDPLILVGHPGHPALARRKVRLEELESMPIISYDRGSSDWTLMNGLFRRDGLLPNIVLEVETIEACKRMVLRKLGLAFLPQIAVVEELRRGKLCPLEITNAEPLRRSLDVILPRRRPLSKSAKELVAGLREATQAPVKIWPRGKKRHRG